MKYLIYGIILFTTAIGFLSYRFWGYNDLLIEKSGIIESFSFIRNSDGRGGSNYQYDIHLISDHNRYQIPAKFINDFKIKEFKREIKGGDNLKILVGPIKNKLSGSYIVFEINSGNKNYLSLEKSKKTDWLEKNVAIPFFGIFFTFIGIFNIRKYKLGKSTN